MPIKLLIVLLLLFSPCVSGSTDQDELSYIVAPADEHLREQLVTDGSEIIHPGMDKVFERFLPSPPYLGSGELDF